MPLSLLDLPLEIRLNIYSHVFVPKIALVEERIQAHNAALIPAKAAVLPLAPVSGQLLRICKQIKWEAEAMFYDRIHFFTVTQAFAGKLPLNFASGASFAPKVKHLTWQLNCDLMKQFYPEDFVVSAPDVVQLENLELRSQAENWKRSFCGEWVDREVFVRGRDQMICYAQKLQALMNEGCARKVFLVEDRTGLSRGRVVLRLSRRKPTLAEDEILIDRDSKTVQLLEKL